MNKTSKDPKKQKLKLTSSGLIFCDTFFRNDNLHFFLQCQSKEVFVGFFDSDYQLIWRGEIKQKVTCVTYCEQEEILYAGSCNGVIAYFSLQKCQEQPNFHSEVGKIDSVSQSNIKAMFAYHNGKDKTSQLIAVNSAGVVMKYGDNRYQISVEFPFKIEKALSNKSIQNVKDVAMVWLTREKKIMYFFTAETLIGLCNSKATKSQVEQLILRYEQSMNYYLEEQICASEVSLMAMSNTKKIVVICHGGCICVCNFEEIGKQNQFIRMIPEFQLQIGKQIVSVDIVGSEVLMTSVDSILAFDVCSRKKIGKLSSKNGMIQCNVAQWITSTKILYGLTQPDKMKLAVYDLKKISGNESVLKQLSIATQQ